MIHYFPNDPIETHLPEEFTYPFRYTPHPICLLAAEEVQSYLESRSDWSAELQQGKMFGVLVVRTSTGKIGYLAAFSGNLMGSNYHDYFVPPVFDLLNPDGYFKEEEEQISHINRQIQEIETRFYSPEKLQMQLEELEAEAENAISHYKTFMKQSQQKRNKLRESAHLSEKEQEALIKQSQFEKAELKRIKDNQKARIQAFKESMIPWKEKLESLKHLRKKRSAALQQWIFQQFRMLNAHGEVKDLCEIFAETHLKLPPAGSGECAAPKLLQYAYLQGYSPIAMAEFWWGNSPIGKIRRHGQFYPACKHKCEPILNFMLQGLKVEANPLLITNTDASQLETLYEDEYLLVVNKPAGMLSVPGNNGQASVQSIMQERYPEATGPLMVHRLDMDTSGLLIIAKDDYTHTILQEQFEKRMVKKRYIALLDGSPTTLHDKGFIRLPIRPDYDNCPLQIVDYDLGKPAITRYETLEDLSIFIDGMEHFCTRVAYYPETGRTHQLRVHSAHPEGMDCPILGDPLYGQTADRMYLHAEQLEFRHPHTWETIRIKKEAPF